MAYPSASYAAGAAFGDFDLDGDLDLCVAGWAPESLGNRLFENDGDGTFTDVTGERITMPVGLRGFSPTFADMNGDRYPELLIAADYGTSKYFINEGGVSFTNGTSAGGLGQDDNGMGSAVADVDGVDPFSAAGEQNVGETASRGADIEAHRAGHINGSLLYEEDCEAGYDTA